MRHTISIRLALPQDREALEALQWRASLNNPNDRDALLAHSDAIVLPIEQITAGQVYVAEQAQEIVGFAVLLPRNESVMELDGLFVEPQFWHRGAGRLLVGHCSRVARNNGAAVLRVGQLRAILGLSQHVLGTGKHRRPQQDTQACLDESHAVTPPIAPCAAGRLPTNPWSLLLDQVRREPFALFPQADK